MADAKLLGKTLANRIQAHMKKKSTVIKMALFQRCKSIHAINHTNGLQDTIRDHLNRKRRGLWPNSAHLRDKSTRDSGTGGSIPQCHRQTKANPWPHHPKWRTTWNNSTEIRKETAVHYPYCFSIQYSKHQLEHQVYIITGLQIRKETV